MSTTNLTREKIKLEGKGIYIIILNENNFFTNERDKRDYLVDFSKQKQPLSNRMISGTYQYDKDLGKDFLYLEIHNGIEATIPYKAIKSFKKITQLKEENVTDITDLVLN